MSGGKFTWQITACVEGRNGGDNNAKDAMDDSTGRKAEVEDTSSFDTTETYICLIAYICR